MNILFWGTPNYSVKSLNSLANSEHEIIGVVTQPDRRRSRGKKLCYSPIKERSLDLGIPVYTPNNLNDDSEVKQQILSLEADIYIVVAFGQILPIDILNKPSLGCWNSHASLLPKWRGAAPIQRSLLNGDLETGVGIMFMEETLDTGPILMQQSIIINDSDNLSTLSERLSVLSGDLILNSIQLISNSKQGNNNSLKLISQLEIGGEVSYAKMIRKTEYLIEWSDSHVDIIRKIKGLYPNSYTFWRGKRLKILEARYYNDSKVIKNKPLSITHTEQLVNPGTIINLISKIGLLVSTKTSPIIITKAQLEGKNKASGHALIQQLSANIGDHFGQVS